MRLLKKLYNLDDVLDVFQKYVYPGVEFGFTPSDCIGKGSTEPIGNEHRKKGSLIGIGRGLGHLRMLTDLEYGLVCMTVAHEFRHLVQMGLAREPSDIVELPVTREVCMSSMAYRHNLVQYQVLDKKRCLFETDAEMGAYVYGNYLLRKFLYGSNEDPKVRAERILLDICNKFVPGGHYYLVPEDFKKFPIKTLADLDDAFTRAMDRTKDSQPVWPNKNEQLFTDDFLDAMRRGRTESEDCWTKFVSVNVDKPGMGMKRVEAMACLSAYLYPDEAVKYPVDLSDLTPEVVFGSAFTDSPDRILQYIRYVRDNDIDVIRRGDKLVVPDGYGTEKIKARHDRIMRSVGAAFGSVMEASGNPLDVGKEGPG